MYCMYSFTIGHDCARQKDDLRLSLRRESRRSSTALRVQIASYSHESAFDVAASVKDNFPFILKMGVVILRRCQHKTSTIEMLELLLIRVTIESHSGLLIMILNVLAVEHRVRKKYRRN